MTTPTEFVLWLNGAADVMGEAPTPEQWGAIREKLNESLGFLAAKRLLERAEDQAVREREIELKRAAAIEQMNRHAQFNADIARYQAVVDVHAAKLDLDAKVGIGSVLLGAPPEKPLSFLGATISHMKGWQNELKRPDVLPEGVRGPDERASFARPVGDHPREGEGSLPRRDVRG